jgi:hypothetical protein
MVDTINIDMKQAKQWKGSSLLRAMIVGGCLGIAAPVFAQTDAEHMKDMENKLEAMQNELTQMTSGMVTRSSSGEGLPIHGFMVCKQQQGHVSQSNGFLRGGIIFLSGATFWR